MSSLQLLAACADKLQAVAARLAPSELSAVSMPSDLPVLNVFPASPAAASSLGTYRLNLEGGGTAAYSGKTASLA
jgi:hypothetical protein